MSKNVFMVITYYFMLLTIFLVAEIDWEQIRLTTFIENFTKNSILKITFCFS